MPTPVIVVLVIIGLLILAVMLMFNRLVRLRNVMRDSWSGVETELKRRHDLVPNLVSAVRGYMKFEKQVLENVTKVRAKAARTQQDPEQQGRTESELSQNLSTMFAVSENYPDLQASAHFKALQEELVRTEDRIQSARRFYNGNVRDYNVRCQSVPTNVIAGIFGFKEAKYFEIENSAERSKPEVGL